VAHPPLGGRIRPRGPLPPPQGSLSWGGPTKYLLKLLPLLSLLRVTPFANEPSCRAHAALSPVVPLLVVPPARLTRTPYCTLGSSCLLSAWTPYAPPCPVASCQARHCHTSPPALVNPTQRNIFSLFTPLFHC